eukprot:353698-Chlamydomonas_euryale.AAC.11
MAAGRPTHAVSATCFLSWSLHHVRGSRQVNGGPDLKAQHLRPRDAREHRALCLRSPTAAKLAAFGGIDAVHKYKKGSNNYLAVHTLTTPSKELVRSVEPSGCIASEHTTPAWARKRLMTVASTRSQYSTSPAKRGCHVGVDRQCKPALASGGASAPATQPTTRYQPGQSQKPWA